MRGATEPAHIWIIGDFRKNLNSTSTVLLRSECYGLTTLVVYRGRRRGIGRPLEWFWAVISKKLNQETLRERQGSARVAGGAGCIALLRAPFDGKPRDVG